MKSKCLAFQLELLIAFLAARWLFNKNPLWHISVTAEKRKSFPVCFPIVSESHSNALFLEYWRWSLTVLNGSRRSPQIKFFLWYVKGKDRWRKMNGTPLTNSKTSFTGSELYFSQRFASFCLFFPTSSLASCFKVVWHCSSSFYENYPAQKGFTDNQ